MAGRVDVGSIRRAQIVDAACRVIHRKGIQGASLSEIEQEAGVSRGVLTYHFPSKEDIILAVFDATIARIRSEVDVDFATAGTGWERFERGIDMLLRRKPTNDEFDALNYTFLAQMSHREDFRARLAAQYTEIRGMIAGDLAERARRAGRSEAEIKALAAIVHATFSGLIMQINVEPDAIDRDAVHDAFKAMVGGYLGGDHGPRPSPKGRGRAKVKGP